MTSTYSSITVALSNAVNSLLTDKPLRERVKSAWIFSLIHHHKPGIVPPHLAKGLKDIADYCQGGNYSPDEDEEIARKIVNLYVEIEKFTQTTRTGTH